jgi:putative phage-type endonuclease
MIHNLEQRSAEWFDLRASRVGGSEAHQLLAHPDLTDLPKSALKLLQKKLSGEIDPPFTGYAVQRGINLEAEAREFAAEKSRRTIQEVGYVTKGQLFGCSPDGVIYLDGHAEMWEIKCPLPENYEEQILAIPKRYVDQIFWNMWVFNCGSGRLLFYVSPEQYYVEHYKRNSVLGQHYQELIERRTAQYAEAWQIFNPI